MTIDLGGPERLREAANDPIDDCPQVRGAAKFTGHRRDAPVADAARHDVFEHREVGVDVEREAVPCAAPGDAYTDRRDLAVIHPDARVPRHRIRFDTEIGERGD